MTRVYDVRTDEHGYTPGMGSDLETYRITYGGESVVMSMRVGEASSPIFVDGKGTGLQTWHAGHSPDTAVRLICRQVWGPVHETRKDADAAGVPLGSEHCVWDEVSFLRIEGEAV